MRTPIRSLCICVLVLLARSVHILCISTLVLLARLAVKFLCIGICSLLFGIYRYYRRGGIRSLRFWRSCNLLDLIVVVEGRSSCNICLLLEDLCCLVLLAFAEEEPEEECYESY